MKNLFSIFALLREVFFDKSPNELKITKKEFDIKKWLRYILTCGSIALSAFFISKIYILGAKYIELERQYSILLQTCSQNTATVNTKIEILNGILEDLKNKNEPEKNSKKSSKK